MCSPQSCTDAQDQPSGKYKESDACALKGLYSHPAWKTHQHTQILLSWAEIPYILPALQGTIRISREGEIHIPAQVLSSSSISTFYSRKNLKHHSIGFGQRNKNKARNFGGEFSSKVFMVDWGKEERPVFKPSSFNTFIKFDTIWKEATTGGLCEVSVCNSAMLTEMKILYGLLQTAVLQPSLSLLEEVLE